MPEDVRLRVVVVSALASALAFFALQLVHRAAHAGTQPTVQTVAAAPQLPPATADEQLLGRVATTVAGRDVRVSCELPASSQDGQTELGEAQVVPGSRTSGVVLFAPSICTGLLGFSHGLLPTDWACVQQNGPDLCSVTVDDDILALHTLAHETWHVRGERNEATTDCYALQTVSTAARTLGADAVDANALAVYYAAHFDAIRRPPPAYRSPDCRDGGSLDLHPGAGDWPG